MENSEVHIEGKVTADDYVKANFAILKRNSIMMVAVVCLVLVLIAVVPDLLAGNFADNYTFFAAFAFVLILYLVIRPVSIRRNYKKSAKLQDVVHWYAGSETLKVKTSDTETSYRWSEFKRYYENKNYIFFELRVPKRQVRFIPKRFLGDHGVDAGLRRITGAHFDEKGRYARDDV